MAFQFFPPLFVFFNYSWFLSHFGTFAIMQSETCLVWVSLQRRWGCIRKGWSKGNQRGGLWEKPDKSGERMKQGRAQTTGSSSFYVSPWCRLATAVLACRWLMAVSCCGYFKGTDLQFKRFLSMPGTFWLWSHFHTSLWFPQSCWYGWKRRADKTSRVAHGCRGGPHMPLWSCDLQRLRRTPRLCGEL